MKKFFLPFIFILSGHFVFAQALREGRDQKVQIGLHGWGYRLDGISGTYDHSITKMFSIGAGVSAYFDRFGEKKSNNIFIFGRVNAHLQEAIQLPSQWDIYPGLNAGFLGKSFTVSPYFGARYFFNNNIGIYLEVGNNGNMGISINF